MQHEFTYVPGYGYLRSGQMAYIRAFRCYSLIKLVRGNSLVTSCRLMYYDRALVRFIRASRDYLVNPDYIIRVERIHSREMYLTMIDGTRLRVSRRNVYFVGVILETYKQQLLHESSPRALAYQDEPVGRKRSADQPLLVPVE